MILSRSVLALILARGGSKRVPGKNTRLLGGKPLIAWSIDCAKAVEYIDCTLVSTDSEEIAAIALSRGAEVPWLRPAALSTDTASSNDAIVHALSELGREGRVFDYLVLLQPTSPFRRPSLIREGLERCVAAGGDAVIAFGPARSNPAWCFTIDANGVARPMGGQAGLLARSQDLPEAFEISGSMYAMSVAKYLEARTFFTAGARALIVTDKAANIDIDDELDWTCAEAVAAKLF